MKDSLGKIAIAACGFLSVFAMGVIGNSQTVLAAALDADNVSATSTMLDAGTASSEVIAELSKYHYEVSPLVENFAYYVYLKTDNPDVGKIRLLDSSTKYGTDEASLILSRTVYDDVKYEDASRYRVKDGYIFKGYGNTSDGGTLSIQVQERGVVNGYQQMVWKDTGITVACPEMISSTEYLINTYTTESMTFFEKMDAVQKGVNQLAIYPFQIVDADKPIPNRYPFWATTSHTDPSLAGVLFEQYVGLFETRNSLLYGTYSFILDSLGVPGAMRSVAKTLEPSCTVSSVQGSHELVQVTFDGKSRYYGGAGSGDTKPASVSEVLYLFDGSANDFATNQTVQKQHDKVASYQKLAEEQTAEYQAQLDTIWHAGSWVRVEGAQLQYMYFMNCEAVTQVYDAWVDGRYIGNNAALVLSQFEAAPTFADHPTAGIVLHNVTYTDKKGVQRTTDVLYQYNPQHDCWFAPYAYTGQSSYSGNTFNQLPPELILTREQVMAMTLDQNANRYPDSFLIYDGTAKPGTLQTTTSVTGITLSETRLEFVEMEKEAREVKVTLTPNDASLKTIYYPYWTKNEEEKGFGVDVSKFNSGESDSIYISLSKDTVAGQYRLPIETADGKYRAYIDIEVKPAIRVTGISLNVSQLTLNKYVDREYQFVASIEPANATYQQIEWKTSNSYAGYLDAKTGRFIPNLPQSTTITATTVDGGFTATCEVTVIREEVPTPTPTSAPTPTPTPAPGSGQDPVVTPTSTPTPTPTPTTTPTPAPGPGQDPVVTPTPAPTPTPVTGTPVEQFLTRMYQVCLNRTPDPMGLNYWVNLLTNEGYSGIEVANGFVFSTEFINKNLCNEDFVEQLYQAFMGRASDEGGKAYWIGNMQNGMQREEVLNGFALSNEFTELCKQYGIKRGEALKLPTYGTVPMGPCTICGKKDGVTAFVERLYSVCLDRLPDPKGLQDWTNALWDHSKTGRDVASGFIFSTEFTSKNYSNEMYVEYLYKAFMDRESDQGGKDYWLVRLQKGSTREQIFDGFVESDEFSTICKSYGILRDSSAVNQSSE